MNDHRSIENPEAGNAHETGAESGAGPQDIADVRAQINSIDRDILQLLSERRKCSGHVARLKRHGWEQIRDKDREEALLLDRINAGRSYGLDSHYVTTIFHEIIDDSVRLQHDHLQKLGDRPDGPIKVAFQGIETAYSHLAARQYFSRAGDAVTYLGYDSFEETMTAVETGQADFAVLPIENTTSGGINEVYDLLLRTRLSIVGEEKFKVEHCLLGIGSAAPEEVHIIYSHPQPALQCSRFIASLRNCRVEYLGDTALSARKIMEDRDPRQAAIASEEAARIFGLSVIRRNIANQEENYTRFLVAGRKATEIDPRIPCKTSIVMSTAQEPGSLVDALLVFKERGINLVKLESRPMVGNPWEEMFYVDFEGNIAVEQIREGLDELTRKVRFIKVLGSYAAQDLPPTVVKPHRIGLAGPERLLGSAAGCSPEPESPPPAAAKGYRLASREYKRQDTVVEVRGVKIGGGEFTIIAGPCAVESWDQVMASALEVSERGARILRGGCFKPRSSPYSFQGLGYEGLDMLAEAGKKYGLPIITEVLSPGDVAKVAEKADIIQIGARNMQNFTLLTEAGRIQRPVMLKRGMSCSLHELLGAAEYILTQGNQQVILCERGIRTFETSTRSTLDLCAVPVLKRRSHLPVIVDPSHAAGDRDLVTPLALAAKAAGADGIMVEIHPDPDNALSDGPQALRFPQFGELMERLLRD